MLKRTQAAGFLLAAALVLSACGGGETSDNAGAAAGSGSTESAVSGYLFTNEDYDSVEIGTPDKPLDPAKIYSSITYIPEMLYGRYQVNGGDSAIEKYREEMDYIEYNEVNSVGTERIRNITAIPHRIDAGPKNLLNHITDDKTHHWLRAYFQDDQGNLLTEYFAYEIQGKTISLKHLKYSRYDKESDTLEYELDDALDLSYDFEIKGMTLTLSAGGKSVAMNAGYNAGDEAEPYYYVEHYAAPDGDRIDTIFSVKFRRSREKETRVYFEFVNAEGEKDVIRENSALLSKDGLFTFTIPYEEGEKTYQYVYFYLEEDGIILTDGENVYKYMLDWLDYTNYKLSDVLDDEVNVEDLSESEAQDLIDEQDNILSELEDSFEENDVSADISEATGRVTMDASFLFDVDSTEISEEGKDYLDSFVKAYSKVILARAKEGTVSQIILEGHTDTNGTHEYNQELSEKRAEAVADYCIELQPELAEFIETKGFSYDQPVYDKDGNVDMDASRRVVFKFILNTK